MRVHAAVGADHRLHLLRPAEPWRIDHPLDARMPALANIQAHVAEIAVRGAFDGGEQRIAGASFLSASVYGSRLSCSSTSSRA